MGKEKKAVAANYKIRVSDTASQHINEISGYIAFINHQPSNAIHVIDSLFETIDRISEHPFAFRECEYLPTKTKLYRRAMCLSWQIIYKIVGKEVLILGVVHSSQKPTHIKMLRRVE